MLRIDREGAWLGRRFLTRQGDSAAAATREKLSNPRPASSRKRRAKASRIDAGNWPTRGMTRSIAGMLMGPRDLILNKWIEALAAMTVRPLSRRERVGVRGYGLSMGRNSPPGSQERSDLSLRER